MNTEQGSVAWVTARIGLCTASRFADAISFNKNGEPSQKRKDYLMELVYERLTGAPVEQYVTKAMQWGSDMENQARQVYRERTGATVGLAGFMRHETLACGASPDGLIGFDGGMEIKCPYDGARHLATLLGGMPAEHIPQVQGGMWITGAEWWDFVSYDPRLPEGPDLYVQRIQRDDEYIAKLAEGVKAFLEDVKAAQQKINDMKLQRRAA